MIPPADPAQRVARSRLLAALDQFISFHFGMAASAFPSSLIANLLDELPDLDALRDPGWQAVIMRRLSINETHFLRQSEHFDTLERLACQHKESGERRPFRVWSAACSTGEEVWTIVAALRKAGFTADNSDVFGTDINPDVVVKARKGEYRRWSMRGVAAGSTESWLEVRGEQIRVRDELRSYAKFEPRNLMNTPYPDNWDAIFCRNVMIYLRPDSVQQICAAAFDALRPGGAFFIAATDPVPDASIGFEEVYDGNCRMYRKPGPRTSASAPTPRRSASSRLRKPAPRKSPDRTPRTRTTPTTSSWSKPRPVRNGTRAAAAFDAARERMRRRAEAKASVGSARSAVKPAPSTRPPVMAKPTVARTPMVPAAPKPPEKKVAPPAPPEVSTPDGPDAAEQALEFLDLARSGRQRRALALLTDLADDHPDEIMVQLAMAEISLALGLPKIALAHARSAFFLKPDDIMPNFWVGAAIAASSPSRFGEIRLRKAGQLLRRMSVSETVPLSGGWTCQEVKRRLNDATRA